MFSPNGKIIKKEKMEKLDLTKRYKVYYTAASKPQFVELELAQYLSILGKGDPRCLVEIQFHYQPSCGWGRLCTWGIGSVSS